MAKKFLSIILTLSLVASLFAGLTFNVSAATPTGTENLENAVVKHYGANSSAGSGNATMLSDVLNEVTAGSVVINNTDELDSSQSGYYVSTRNEATGKITTTLQTDCDQRNKEIWSNTTYSVSQDYNTAFGVTSNSVRTVQGRDSQGFYTITWEGDTHTKTYRDVEDNDENFLYKAFIEYNVGYGATVTDIVIGSASYAYRTGYYNVLTSMNGKDWTTHYIYTADKKVDGTNPINSAMQHIKLAAPVKANFVRVEFYANINTVAGINNTKSDNNLRIKTLRVYGTKADYAYNSHGYRSYDSLDATQLNTMKTYYNTNYGGKTSVIAGKAKPTVKYYLTREGCVGTVFDKGNGNFDGGYWYGVPTAEKPEMVTAKPVTDGDVFSTDVMVVADSVKKKMFFKNKTGSDVVTSADIIDDEQKQYLQLDYELDAETEISELLLLGKSSNTWTPSHYKYYIADTADGLYNEANCVAEVHKGSRIASVKLNTPVTGKFVGLRIISGYNVDELGYGDKTYSYTSASGMYLRFTEFQVFGNYKDGVAADLTANAYADGVQGATTSAVLSYKGQVDTAGKYSAANVALSADAAVESSGKTYSFDGWYLGEQLVSASATDTYKVTGKEADLNFVAKYVYKDHAIVSSTDRNDYVDPATSLLENYVAKKGLPKTYLFNLTDNMTNEFKTTDGPKEIVTSVQTSAITRAPFVDQNFKEIDMNTWTTKAELVPEGGQKFAPADVHISDRSEVKNNLSVTYKYDDAKGKWIVDDIIDDESIQWAQINYELDAAARISEVALSNLRNFEHASDHWTPSHYKVILSDTAEGLLDESLATKVVEVTGNKASISKIVFAEPVIAKFVGLRIICAYNKTANLAYEKGVMYPRFNHFDVVGEYVDTISEKTVSAEAVGATTAATAEFTRGNAIDDSVGNYAAGYVALSTTGTFAEGNQPYNFVGWYLNDELVSTSAEYTYVVKSTDDEKLNFVAKYDAPACTISGYNIKEDYINNVDINKNLLVGAKFDSIYYLNKETYEDKNLQYLTANEPTELTSYSEHTNKFTASKVDSSTPDIVIKDDQTFFNNMFVDYNAEGTGVGTITEDESKQWLQINYTLPAEATIDSFTVAALKSSTDVLSRWTPKHYKLILANNKADLISGENTVEIDVNHSAGTIKNITNVALIQPATAKYVAIRFIQPYNDFAGTKLSGNFVYSKDMRLYLRMSRFDVYGTYTAPVTDDISAKAEDTEGATLDIATNVSATGVGGYDNNEKYGKKVVTLTAEETKVIGDYEYTFAGWYLNGETTPILATTEGTVELASSDAAAYVAKYNAQKLVTYHPVHFVDATQKVIKTINVVEGEYLDPAVVNAIVVKEIYGYTVKRDNEGNVEWNEDVYANPVTAEITYTAQYKALDISSLVTLYKTDSDEYYVHEHYKYDTAIDLVYEGANSWVDGEGVVLIGEPTGRIYASGDRMLIYAKSDIQEAPEVAIVGKAHEEAKGFSVFAHVNVQNAEAYGILYASNTYYTTKNDDFKIGDVTPEGSQVISVQKIEVTTENVGQVDFMTTLNYKADKPNPTRWARAYVVIDGQYYYSQIVCNQE